MGARQNVVIILLVQAILLILFGIFGVYNYKDAGKYAMFQDVHVMIFIGFGFLMTFLRRYGFSSVGFNFLLAALIVQWSILCNGFYELNKNYKIEIGIESLFQADIAAATVLISMGAVLGRTSYIQLILMGIIEIAIFSANSYLGLKIFKISDAGGSIFVHTFGAYFGLAVSYILNRRNNAAKEESQLEESRYTSDLFAMIGTVFLWLYWPSFNAIELEGDDQQRAVINTYLSLSACCVTTFAISLLMSHEHKFDMVHIQNSTLAGGVAVGTCANLMLQPFGAILVGIIAGVFSVVGYSKITPVLKSNFGVPDTCGVHNLHGMPGVLAGIIGVIMAAIATEDDYSKSLYEIYPARVSPNVTLNPEFHIFAPGDGRTAGQQAGYQAVALIVTLLIAVVAGLITGLVLSWSKWDPITAENQYNDALWWALPELEQKQKLQETNNENYKPKSHFDNPSFEVPKSDVDPA